jgi:hypothetical protein
MATAAAAAAAAATASTWTILVFLLVMTTARASSTSTSTSSYEDVRRLDKYGHSVQLKHAAMASQRHGRLVVAISWNGGEDAPENDGGPVVLLCTPLPADVQLPITHEETEHPQQRDVLRFTSRGVQRIRMPLASPPPASGQQQHRSNGDTMGVSPLACVLTSSSAIATAAARHNRQPWVAVSCSGLASDAQFVYHQLREAAKEAWDTYDADMPGPAVLTELQGLCRQFWRHPTKRQWSWKQQQQSGGDGDGDDEDNESSGGRWSRPLGVTTLVVQLNPFQDAAQLYAVDPSGIVQPAARIVGRHTEDDDDASDASTFRRGPSLMVACIGREGPAVQARLEKALRERIEASSSAQTRWTQDDLLEMIGDAVEDRPLGWRDRASSSESEPAAADRNERNSPLLYVEVLSTHGGIERKVVASTTAA